MVSLIICQDERDIHVSANIIGSFSAQIQPSQYLTKGILNPNDNMDFRLCSSSFCFTIVECRTTLVPENHHIR
jgi:hypothetical protein